MKRTLAIVSFLLFLGLATRAHAYPQFQFSSDTAACNLCHYAPAGGGMLTEWGRDEAADTLSRGGNGQALHGLVELPDWLDMGGDLRLASALKDNGDIQGTRFLGFPMQADLRLRVQKDALFVQAVAGLRGKARHSSVPAGSLREEAGALSLLVSREHYIGYRADGSKNTYRAGRFYAPYGLRLPDHTSYTRRYLGFNIMQENNAENETHLSAHISDPILGPDTSELGITAMHERRGESSATGASLRATRSDSHMRVLAGTHYKKWLSGPKLMLMAELDGAFQRLNNPDKTNLFQLAGYVGPVWFPTKGVSTSVAYEIYDEDVRVKHVERQALSTWVSFLPRAHYEVFALGRAEKIGARNEVYTAMLQLHYYL